MVRAPEGGTDDDPAATGVLRGAARWAWERDEVERTVSKRKLLYSVALYGVAFLLSFGVGVALWLSGRQILAATFWIVANGLTAVFGTIAVGWDALELLAERRARGRDTIAGPEPDRELAADLGVSRDAKISFLVTVALFLLITAAVFGAKALL